MKKKILIINSILVILVFALSLTLSNSNDDIILSDNNKSNLNNGFLTLMLEQSDGTYQKSTSNTWPTGNYAFNSTLSGCERGGELEWDREANIVKLLNNKSDKCYVYFDLYNVVQISNVSTSSTYNSITITVTTSGGENQVDKYYFSIDGGNSYQESTSPSYTFSNLTSNHEYVVQVYAKDIEGYGSNEEVVEVTTDNYANPIVNTVTVTDTTTSSISVSVSASGGTNNVATYYYSINNGSYTSSSSNTHTFSGLNKGTTYSIKVYVKDTNGVNSNIYTISAETENTVLLADYIKRLYTSQGSNGLYYHTSSLANSAADNSYRYAGSNPNNYVCFGSDASTCPSDNLYRIIGVFGDNVKLIKNSSYGKYSWDNSTTINPYGNNYWRSSSIRTELNSNFLNTFNSNWQNKINNYGWSAGSASGISGGTVKAYYENEMDTSSPDYIKIGLMYISDYGYASSPENWELEIDNSSDAVYKNNNWMFKGITEWTITQYNINETDVYALNKEGYVYGYYKRAYYSYDVRPTFYLNSDVQYISGFGTQSSPMRIN